MRRVSRHLAKFAFAMSLVAPVIVTGCAARVGYGYRAYNPGRYGYYARNSNEEANYLRWERETHREHRDIRKRRAEERHEYSQWLRNQR